jgi:cation diffusion facilitator family transporter
VAEESKGAVLAAMAANFAIAAGKLAAGLLTGSAAMLAEAGHSIADTVNQVFLLVGINLSSADPDDVHPYGYGKEAFFWSFLAAIFIFVAGAAFSIFEGSRTLIQEENHHRSGGELAVAFGVLGMAFVFESISFAVAIRALLSSARKKGWSVIRYIRRSPDLTTKTVFYEDGAALTGLALAAAGLAMSEVTGTEVWDGIASLGIGLVLTAVAFILGLQARRLLIGASASTETRQSIDATLATFPEVRSALRVLTMQIGPHSVLVSGELQVRQSLSLSEAEDLIERIDRRLESDVPEVAETFWEIKGPR